MAFQIDIEMAFATREDVMQHVEELVKSAIWPELTQTTTTQETVTFGEPVTPGKRKDFPQYSYKEVMDLYGSDKPDVRLGSTFHRVESWIPPQLKQMLSPLDHPIFELMMIRTEKEDATESAGFVSNFFDAPSSAEFISNPHGAPGIAVFDPQKPLNGLASFGHDGASQLETLLQPKIGSIIIIQARPNQPHTGSGSTVLGKIRREMLHAAVQQGLRSITERDSFIWVTDFPLFTPVEASPDSTTTTTTRPRLKSTHHPFTAPHPSTDLTRLTTHPLTILSDSYDLVINGVEVGGGSRRIHQSSLQRKIFADCLGMSESDIESSFGHLLAALDSGCPPHAGFALGFDRLLAVGLKKGSVRDVMAFPKSGGYNRGGVAEDGLVGSPGKVGRAEAEVYHLKT